MIGEHGKEVLYGPASNDPSRDHLDLPTSRTELVETCRLMRWEKEKQGLSQEKTAAHDTLVATREENQRLNTAEGRAEANSDVQYAKNKDTIQRKQRDVSDLDKREKALEARIEKARKAREKAAEATDAVESAPTPKPKPADTPPPHIPKHPQHLSLIHI